MDPQLRDDVAELHARLCSGLADPTRILLLYALADGPHSVGELAEALESPQPTVSRHLRELRDRRIVTSERQGQNVFYALRDARIIEALDLLRAMLGDMLTCDAQLIRQATPTPDSSVQG